MFNNVTEYNILDSVQVRLYSPRTEFHFFEIVSSSLSFCDEGFSTRYVQVKELKITLKRGS